MLEIDVYHEIHSTGFLFGAASSARDTRISICRQALFWQSPSWFINNLGASGYAVFIAPIPFLINRFRSSNHRGSILNNHCSLIVYDLYLSFPPRAFSCGRTSVSLWTDFSFQHLSFRTAQVLFQCRSRLQTICSSCFFGSLLFAVLDPSLKLPDIVFPFHLCTRLLHHKICFWESWGSSGLLPLFVSCLTLKECFQHAAGPLWAVCCECLGRGEPQPAVMFGLGADAGSSGTVCTPRTGPSASEFCTESLRALRTWTCVWDRGTSGK